MASNDTDPIDVNAAASIAREHGLGLPDAQALAGLARTVGEARNLAAMFAGKRTAASAQQKSVPGLNSTQLEDDLRRALGVD